MLAMFGCTRIKPSSINSALAITLKQQNKTQGILLEGQPVPNTDVILAWSAPAITQNSAVLHKKRSVIVAFDCIERLAELAPMEIIDLSTTNARTCAQQILAALQQKKNHKIEYAPIDVLKPILDKRKSTGFLHTYNTHLYKVANKELRENLRGLIFAAMAGNITLPVFLAKANAMVPARGKARDAALNLISVVDSPNGAKLRDAIQAVRQNKETRDNAVIKYKVESYDLGYLLAQVDKLEKAKPHGKASASAAKSAVKQPAAAGKKRGV